MDELILKSYQFRREREASWQELDGLLRYGRGIDTSRITKTGFNCRYSTAGAVDSFIPAVEAIILVTDLTTALLLFTLYTAVVGSITEAGVLRAVVGEDGLVGDRRWGTEAKRPDRLGGSRRSQLGLRSRESSRQGESRIAPESAPHSKAFRSGSARFRGAPEKWARHTTACTCCVRRRYLLQER